MVLSSIFINELDREHRLLIRFADDTKMAGIANTLEDRNKIQNGLERLEHWAENNRMKFNRDKCKVKRKQTVSKKANAILGSINRSIDSKSLEIPSSTLFSSG